MRTLFSSAAACKTRALAIHTQAVQRSNSTLEAFLSDTLGMIRDNHINRRDIYEASFREAVSVDPLYAAQMTFMLQQALSDPVARNFARDLKDIAIDEVIERLANSRSAQFISDPLNELLVESALYRWGEDFPASERYISALEILACRNMRLADEMRTKLTGLASAMSQSTTAGIGAALKNRLGAILNPPEEALLPEFKV